jgi:peptidyl-prolyl cis-trans isomerase D
MFDFVRAHTRLFQGLLVLLIFPSFVFFGVQGYTSMRDSNASTAAEVDGKPIRQADWDAAHRQQIERVRRQVPDMDMKLIDTPQMRQETLDALIRERVLMAAANHDHLAVSDERLARLFRSDAQFAAVRNPDGSVNKEMLSAQGMTSEYFAQQLRQEYALRQVLDAVAGTQVLGRSVPQQALAALLEQREVQWQLFPAKDYLAKVNPSEADLVAYHKAHQERFRTTEEADIEWVQLDLDTLARQYPVAEDKLREYYEQNISRYTVAEERRASHILIAVAKDAPAAEREKAKAKAQALLAEVRKNPASFAEVARKNSQDPGSASKGGDLDFFGRGAMTKPFDAAVFAMKPGEISDVVATDFGFHIIQLVAARGGDKKSFDSVKAELAQEVGRQQAQSHYAEAAEQLSNMVYEQADTLQAVMDKLKLERRTATVRRTPAQGASGALASSKLLEAVFSNDSLKNKRNTEAVEVGANQMVSARVLAYRPERAQTLDEVRAQVLEQVRSEQAAALAAKEGQQRLAALKADMTQSLPQADVVSRVKQNPALPPVALEAILRADVVKGAAAVGVDLGTGQGYGVLKVLKLVARDPADADAQQAQPIVSRALAEAETDAYYASLKRRFKVTQTPLKNLATKDDAKDEKSKKE